MNSTHTSNSNKVRNLLLSPTEGAAIKVANSTNSTNLNLNTTTCKYKQVKTANLSQEVQGKQYKALAHKNYNNLPKQLKTITASTSYCKHTNTKLVTSTGFHNCKLLTSLVPSEHPIFSNSIPLITAIAIYSTARTTTERYLAMTACLVKAHLIDTSKCGLHYDDNQFNIVEAKFQMLLPVLKMAVERNTLVEIETLLIDSELQSNTGRMKIHLEGAAQSIDNANFISGGEKLIIIDNDTTSKLKLEEEIKLERELSKILNGYGTRNQSTKYDKNLNRWTHNTLKRSELLSEDQLNFVMKTLNTKPDLVRIGTVDKILPLVEEALVYDDELSRRNSALVIRHLVHIKELQTACLYKQGFIAEVIEEEYINEKTLTAYNTKVSNEQLANSSVPLVKKSNALAALKAKMKK